MIQYSFPITKWTVLLCWLHQSTAAILTHIYRLLWQWHVTFSGVKWSSALNTPNKPSRIAEMLLSSSLEFDWLTKPISRYLYHKARHTRRIWSHNIEKNHEETGRESADWIEMSVGSEQRLMYWATVNIRFPRKK